jgi:hypothetical protein
MNIQTSYRHGAVGALLDIYEQVIQALMNVIEDINDEELIVIVDPTTMDDSCRSFQTILSHVVHGGFGYATSIHNLTTPNLPRRSKTFHSTVTEYMQDLDEVFTFTSEVFAKIKDEDLEQPDAALKIKTNWGQLYDIEQLTEHAIVHILRHKRQIEKFKIKLRSA